MAYVVIATVEPGDASSATADAAPLTAVEALNVQALNLRPEAVAAPHVDVTHDPDAADTVLGTVSWIGTHAPSGTSVHGDVDPGTAVAPGAVTLELLPPNAARATMQSGDVLRWHFGCNVDATDFAGNQEEDLYFVEVWITGVDANGTTTKGGSDTEELGIVQGYSMLTAAQSAALPAGTVKELQYQRLHATGFYIHEGEFTASGGNVRISAIRVRIYVQNAANAVTVSHCSLTAMICKG